MPIRNEERFIARSLGAVLAQDLPDAAYEVLVVDGMSDDGTLAAIEATARAAGWQVDVDGTGALDGARGGVVRVLPNPKRTAPAAMNVGIGASAGAIVVRVDGHCEIEPDYVRRCIEVIEAEGYECVGGVLDTITDSEAGRAIAIAQSSVFGVGNNAYRVRSENPGFSDTVPFGAYQREVFDRIGGFDEELVRNQDDELNFRLLQSGGRVWYDPSIRSRYHARDSLRALWRQYFQYGSFKVRVAQKRGGFASWRHVVPGAFVVALAGSVAVGALTRHRRVALVVAVPYVAVNLAESVRLGRREHASPVRIARAFSVLHLAYGTGFVSGVWRWRSHFRDMRGGRG
jgi:succinoglycan biosynthesis protein ExoA